MASTRKLTDLDLSKDKSVPFRRKPFTAMILENVQLVWTNITVEPLAAALGICDRINMLAIQHLNFEKACRTSFQYGDEICTAVIRGTNHSQYDLHKVNCQSLVTEMTAWVNFFLYLFPPFLLLFIGAYSDRTKRRKTFILVPFIGYIASTVGLIVSAVFFDAVPLVYTGLIEALLPGMFGYWLVLYMAMFTYISSITMAEERTFRIGLISTTLSAFSMLGAAITEYVVQYLGYVGSFSLTFFIYSSCFVYALVYIPEIKRSEVLFGTQPKPEETSAVSDYGRNFVVFLRELFDFRNVRDTFVFLFRKDSSRDDRKKHGKIVLMMINGLIMWGPCAGEFTVLYLYTRSAFHWNEYNNNSFNTIYYLTEFLGTLFSVAYFTKYLQVQDSLLGVIAVVSTLCGTLIFAFANTSFIFCSGALASLFSNASFVAMRSIISKLTSAEELGKVMSVFMLCEGIAQMTYNPMYSAVYKATINTMPSSFFLVGGVTSVSAIFMFLWIYREDRKLKKVSLSREETTSEDQEARNNPELNLKEELG
uniref:Proton-coupled folate transporter n=1 Tax=Cacopsylla melanoneura TaxID=428564 RepID=A0A8D9E080_9HEMI